MPSLKLLRKAFSPPAQSDGVQLSQGSAFPSSQAMGALRGSVDRGLLFPTPSSNHGPRVPREEPRNHTAFVPDSSVSSSGLAKEVKDCVKTQDNFVQPSLSDVAGVQAPPASREARYNKTEREGRKLKI